MQENPLIVNTNYTIESITAMVDNEWMGLPRDFDERLLENPLMDAERGAFFKDNYVMEIMDVMSNPDYFWYTCKYLFNIELAPFQLTILRELWKRKFPMLIATRGGGKTWILALYCMLRAIFTQGSKIVVVGAAFRQSKLIFEYMENFWRSSGILQHIIGGGKHEGPKRDIDRCNFYLGNSEIIAIPLGDGSKIRGLRAHYVVADEFASIPQEIFEVVIKGFSSVSASPARRSWDQHYIEVLKSIGMHAEAESEQDKMGFGNQTIISGTAYYHFNHFYQYWKRYSDIIRSRGDKQKLEEIFHGEVPTDFDWKQFSVARIPFRLLPKGFMDETQIAQSKAMVHSAIYKMEYEAVFAKDSDGFFKRSLIESCVTKNPIQLVSGPVQFHAVLGGSPNLKYVYGIDPASEHDNFSIIVLEVHPDHRRIVYCWTVSRQKLRERMKNKGKATEKSFYAYCVRKIRDLMKVFPTNHIGMDTQGGGIAVMEGLHDIAEIEEGELQIWPYIKQGDNDVFWWEEKDKPTDPNAGLHILHMVQFANAEWTVQANHGLRKDFEDKITLFPFFDSVSLGLAAEQDKLIQREYDNLEDCTVELESLKDELATIQHTQTTNGRDRWDTPETKEPGGKRGRLRKDRYTALVIANMVARTLQTQPASFAYNFAGGFVGQKRGDVAGPMYVGPEHLVTNMQGSAYGRGVSRNR